MTLTPKFDKNYIKKENYRSNTLMNNTVKILSCFSKEFKQSTQEKKVIINFGSS